MMLSKSTFTTPIGPLTVVVDGDGAVKQLHFGKIDVAGAKEDAKAVRHVRDQIDEYFAGKRRKFDLRLAPDGTEFQRRVWKALSAIPFGETLSYGELAARIGRAGASRAVGAANGANPIAVIVPCHRVIGQNRSLTGYAGGVSTKAALLAHEGLLPHSVAKAADARTRIDAEPKML